MKHLLLSLRMLKRDLRSGELKILVMALVVAVASVTSVGFFTDRIHQALRLQANELLAADLVVSSDRPLTDRFADQAERLALRHSPMVQFRSMVFAGGGTSLVEIKAVSSGYPLRGALRISDNQLLPDREVRRMPAPGSVWVEAELLRRTGLQAGDELPLGAARLRIAAVITYEPDRGGGFFSIAPRVMMNSADLPATELIQEGSRVRYQLLVAGQWERVMDYRRRFEDRLERGQRLVDVTDSRQEIRQALDRANRFLGLAALVSVMLAGVAVAMVTRRHVVRNLDSCAIMRCVGAGQNDILWLFGYEMLWLGLFGSLAGAAVGFVAHQALAEMLAELFVARLPAPSLWPLFHGVVTGLLTLAAFALPPLMHLRNVPTMRVLRRELGMLPAPALTAYGLAALAMAGLLLFQARDPRLGLYVLAGLLATILVLLLLATLLVRLVRLVSGGSGWRFGIANVARRSRSSVLQVLAFGVGIMALMLLALVRGELLVQWQQRLPADTPNHFIINIQQEQLAGLRTFFSDRELPVPESYGMIRARLLAINDRSVTAADYTDERSRRLVEREFNLSWMQELRDDNHLVQGTWWPATSAPPQFSVEEDIARHLGIGLGDRLRYSIAGEIVEAPVTSLRKVQWDSFRANFFVLSPPGTLDTYPASWITAFYLPPERQGELAALVRQYPNFSVIDVSAVMDKVRTIVVRVTDAVEVVFLFTLAAGLMVLYAAIAASHDERVRESAIVRTLGASRRQLLGGLVAEFVLIGALAGAVAALAATLTGLVVAEKVLEIPYDINPWVVLAGVVGGALGVGLAGFLGTRGLLARPPLRTLQRAEAG